VWANPAVFGGNQDARGAAFDSVAMIGAVPADEGAQNWAAEADLVLVELLDLIVVERRANLTHGI